jgi:uncharacterized membrane protein (UPF0127 family)
MLRRLVGLMGRASLPPGHALLLDPCASIHTCFMRFAIDVAFLDEENRVVRMVRQLAPWRLAGARGSRKCVEMAGGALSTDLAEGDCLKLES